MSAAHDGLTTVPAGGSTPLPEQSDADENGVMVIHGTHDGSAPVVHEDWHLSPGGRGLSQLASAPRNARATIASSQTRRMIALPG